MIAKMRGPLLAYSPTKNSRRMEQRSHTYAAGDNYRNANSCKSDKCCRLWNKDRRCSMSAEQSHACLQKTFHVALLTRHNSTNFVNKFPKYLSTDKSGLFAFVCRHKRKIARKVFFCLQHLCRTCFLRQFFASRFSNFANEENFCCENWFTKSYL